MAEKGEQNFTRSLPIKPWKSSLRHDSVKLSPAAEASSEYVAVKPRVKARSFTKKLDSDLSNGAFALQSKQCL